MTLARVATCVVVAFLVADVSLRADPLEWPLEEGGNGHFYEQITVPGGIGFAEAQSDVATRSLFGVVGHLVTVTSQEENDFLIENFQMGETWIGLTDRVAEGVFEWVTGEPFNYDNWRPNEPNNAGDEDYVTYTADESGWNDTRDMRTQFGGGERSYIVEFPIPPQQFRRGDANADGNLDVTDPVAMLDFFFGPRSMPCREAADVSNDGELNISDAIGLLGYLFLGTLPPPAPFLECGRDPDDDGLDCEEFPPCDAATPL